MKITLICMAVILSIMAAGCVEKVPSMPEGNSLNVSAGDIFSTEMLNSSEKCDHECIKQDCVLDAFNENASHIECGCYCSWVPPHQDNVLKIVIEK